MKREETNEVNSNQLNGDQQEEDSGNDTEKTMECQSTKKSEEIGK